MILVTARGSAVYGMRQAVHTDSPSKIFHQVNLFSALESAVYSMRLAVHTDFFNEKTLPIEFGFCT